MAGPVDGALRAGVAGWRGERAPTADAQRRPCAEHGRGLFIAQ
ncbi:MULTISPECIES: hypothetical protein [unclassified Streptomyces]|nr:MULTISPECIES: hypothetical protein [unclassified Streptomyces]